MSKTNSPNERTEEEVQETLAGEEKQEEQTEETDHSPDSTPPPDEIIFSRHPPPTTCTLEEVTYWMNEFPTLEKQSRALFWIVKKLIDVRDDKKQPRKPNPQFINLPTLERDENTSLEKILRQARSYNNDLEIKTTVSTPSS